VIIQSERLLRHSPSPPSDTSDTCIILGFHRLATPVNTLTAFVDAIEAALALTRHYEKATNYPGDSPWVLDAQASRDLPTRVLNRRGSRDAMTTQENRAM